MTSAVAQLESLCESMNFNNCKMIASNQQSLTSFTIHLSALHFHRAALVLPNEDYHKLHM